MKENRPVTIQSDATLLVDVHDPAFEEARNDVSVFAELEKSPEHIHTYKLSSLSLWNAASVGISPDEIIRRLERWSKYDIPDNIIFRIRESAGLFGKIVLIPSDDPYKLILKVTDKKIFNEIRALKKIAKLLIPADNIEDQYFFLKLIDRGTAKQELINWGYPVKDEVPLKKGAPLDITFRETTLSGHKFSVRDYQKEAALSFHGEGKPGNGFGTIVLACGSGKTVVGMKVMEIYKTNTLILTTNITAVRQWQNELLDKTNLPEEQIGEYTGDKKLIRPITIATYQILTWRPDKEADFPHFDIFRKGDWGLIIYDEVHLLPAPVFRVTAELQAISRLGLTATLIREDGRETDVFSLVGPKRFDCPWKTLQEKGWIAEANCFEIRTELPHNLEVPYVVADKREKFRIAAENPVKFEIVKDIIENHREDSILIIGQYISQLKKIQQIIKVPIITGQTPNNEREKIFNLFRKGKEKIIIVSKVANFAVDLPDASVAIQISGSFGSRQEEAQRLGRILRPKEKNANFYSIVSNNTVEEEFSSNRQKFLTEQGYKYHIELR
ncbi:MAG: helicase-associated domain-containing protein [Spirochaetaceae bacterium]|nr:helicase-associated domain-containing protein [Spirochaetaceae bacterium]